MDRFVGAVRLVVMVLVTCLLPSMVLFGGQDPDNEKRGSWENCDDYCIVDTRAFHECYHVGTETCSDEDCIENVLHFAKCWETQSGGDQCPHVYRSDRVVWFQNKYINGDCYTPNPTEPFRACEIFMACEFFTKYHWLSCVNECYYRCLTATCNGEFDSQTDKVKGGCWCEGWR